jgi:hypothetical protein
LIQKLTHLSKYNGAFMRTYEVYHAIIPLRKSHCRVIAYKPPLLDYELTTPTSKSLGSKTSCIT